MDRIRKVEIGDTDAIYKYEMSFFRDYWSKNQIVIEINNINAINLGFEKNSRLIGYIFARKSLDFVEILKIAVSKSFRKIGIAKELMKEIEELSIQLQRKKIILEVREGNNSAITLYKKLGYKVSYFDPAKKLLNEIDKSKIDLIFNSLHGKDGEDGNAQSFFEYLKVPGEYSFNEKESISLKDLIVYERRKRKR